MKHLAENVIVQTAALYPHPEAYVPIGWEARKALRESLEERGLYQALLVMERELGGFWIIDGRNRFEVLRERFTEFPCNIVELEEGESVYDIALECATKGRDRTSGQRIMAYMLRNKEAVLEAVEKGCKATQFGAGQSRDRAEKIGAFSSKGIAATLGVSDKDTLLCAELLKCHEQRMGVSRTVGGLKEPGQKLEEGSAELKAIDEVYEGVLSGTVPIRRCMAAIGGKKATNDVQRAAINWYDVGKKALASLRGLGGHWEGLAMEDRMELLQLVREAAAALPREVREGFAP